MDFDLRGPPMPSPRIRLTEGDLGNIVADAYIVSSTGAFSGGAAKSVAAGLRARPGALWDDRRCSPRVGEAAIVEVARKAKGSEAKEPSPYLVVCANTGAKAGRQTVAAVGAAFRSGLVAAHAEPQWPAHARLQ